MKRMKHGLELVATGKWDNDSQEFSLDNPFKPEIGRTYLVKIMIANEAVTTIIYFDNEEFTHSPAFISPAKTNVCEIYFYITDDYTQITLLSADNSSNFNDVTTIQVYLTDI